MRNSPTEHARALCLRCIDSYGRIVLAAFEGEGVEKACSQYSALLREYVDAIKDVGSDNEKESGSKNTRQIKDAADWLSRYHLNSASHADSLATLDRVCSHAYGSLALSLQMVAGTATALQTRGYVQGIMNSLQPPLPMPKIANPTQVMTVCNGESIIRLRKEHEELQGYAVISLCMRSAGHGE
jgi:hypothetical protein